MAENSYSKIAKKHEKLKRFAKNRLKSDEFVKDFEEPNASAQEKFADSVDKKYAETTVFKPQIGLSKINYFNPYTDESFESQSPEQPDKLEVTVDKGQTKTEFVDEKSPEQKPQEQEKVYLTIEEIAKLPGAHKIGYLENNRLIGFRKDYENLVKKEKKEKGFDPNNKKNFYVLCNTLLQYVLKEYDEEKAEDLIKNHKKHIADSEERNLADLIKKIESSEEEIFLTTEELSLIKGAKGFCDLRAQILPKWSEDEKNYRQRKEKINQTGGPKPKEYRLAPELVEKVFKDKEVIAKVLSAYEKRTQNSAQDEKVLNAVYDGLETLTDEEFFKCFEQSHPIDDNEQEHENVFFLKKKIKHNGKEYEVKYVFKPTKKQDKNRRIGVGNKYEEMSQMSQTLSDLAASIVDEELGFGLFDKTQLKTHSVEGVGSLRRYSDNYTSMRKLDNENKHDLIFDTEGLKERTIFRYIVNEIDTNDQNWGVQVGKDGKNKIKIIDISQAFGIAHTYNDLNRIRNVSPETKEKIMNLNVYRLRQRLEQATKGEDFSEQIDGCIKRIDALKEHLRRQA